MTKYLLDSGLVIRHLRGHKAAVQFLRSLGKAERLSISVVTRLEVRAGMLPEEQYVTHKLLSRFVTLDLDGSVADLAGDLVRDGRNRGAGLSIPDAVIAATAIVHGQSLVTYNRVHFQGIPGLSLYPLPDDLAT